MSAHAFASPLICNRPSPDIEGFNFLAELALNMHSLWNHSTDEVWRQLDPAHWELADLLTENGSDGLVIGLAFFWKEARRWKVRNYPVAVSGSK